MGTDAHWRARPEDLAGEEPIRNRVDRTGADTAGAAAVIVVEDASKTAQDFDEDRRLLLEIDHIALLAGDFLNEFCFIFRSTGIKKKLLPASHFSSNFRQPNRRR
jgi:hypothetical protein